MSNLESTTSLTLILLLAGSLSSPARAGGEEAERWNGGPIPAERIYVPGRGTPPTFAPAPEREPAAPERPEAARTASGPSSWIERYRQSERSSEREVSAYPN